MPAKRLLTTIGQAAERGRGVRAARRAAILAAGVLLFVFSWLLRFNDPGGAFAGLTDDHFFYLVRGWQILFGDLPVRDFVDHGAPLYFYLAAAVQQWLGRGTVSELTFAVTVLSAAATLTFWLATRASGSILCGMTAALVHVLLEPRFYNYPKILVYTIAIPLLWRFADRPGPWPRFWVAVVTVIAFLFRHDHGPFVAVAFAALLASLRDTHWHDRLRHAAVYSALVLALLSPYLVFIQLNGGLGAYSRDALAWAARDRERAPIVWPGMFDESAAAEAPAAASPPARAVALVRVNFVAWMFYLELALPILSLIVLGLSRDGFRPDWPRAIPKLTSVAVLGVVLNAGFLRHPLEARLADPSVPHAILLAWLTATMFRAVANRVSFRPGLERWGAALRIALAVVVVSIAFVLWAGLAHHLDTRLRKAALVVGPAAAMERVGHVRRQLREDWQLASWKDRPDRPDLISLALYLDACTRPDDRVFIQQYAPQVLALARRAFAGGHADLRPGFFEAADAQRLTIDRLRRQQVPVVLLEAGEDNAGFREAFPLITAYFDEQYAPAGTHIFDRRFGVQLWVRKGTRSYGIYEPFGWPCLAPPPSGSANRPSA
jgi:hypothetical protein